MPSALKLQLSTIAGEEPATSYLELRAFDRADRRVEQRFIPVRDADGAIEMIAALAPQSRDIYVGAAPRTRKEGNAAAVARVWCLWADCDSPAALAALETFRPQPSLLIRSGTGENVHAWWALDSAIKPEWARRANRRLALALEADMVSTDPARILRPVGTLNHKHSPPSGVSAARAVSRAFTLPEVIGGLRDVFEYLPKPSAFRQSAIGRKGSMAGLTRTVRDAPQGERNSLLYWAACRVRDQVQGGELDPELACQALRAAALDAGLEEAEIEATLRSALGERGVA
jgi:hypothetical protein